MKNDSLLYTNLILKELSGDISKSEVKRLLEWKNSSEEAEAFYNKLLESWNLKITDNDTETDLIFNNLFPSEELPLSVDIVKKNTFLTWVTRVAAIFIIVFASLYFFQDKDISYLIVNNDNAVKVDSLIDGTKLWLKSNSEVFVENGFGIDSRRVKVMGDVYFDVATDNKIPFYVITDIATIKVTGTEFQVSYSPSSKNVEVNVSSGKVQFFNDEDISSSSCFKTDLVAGEKASFSLESGEMVKQNQTNTNYLFWKTGEIIFKSTPLSGVIKELNEIYNVNIYSSFLMSDRYRLTARFFEKDIEDIVNGINDELVDKFKLEEQALLILENKNAI